MKQSFLMILFCILNLPNISSAEWVPVLKNTTDDTIYYDPKMIVENGSKRHIRMYSNYANPKSDGKNSIFSSMMHLAIDCKMKTFSILQRIDYSYMDLQGNSYPKNFQYPKISTIPNNSSISELEKKICD